MSKISLLAQYGLLSEAQVATLQRLCNEVAIAYNGYGSDEAEAFMGRIDRIFDSITEGRLAVGRNTYATLQAELAKLGVDAQETAALFSLRRAEWEYNAFYRYNLRYNPSDCIDKILATIP